MEQISDFLINLNGPLPFMLVFVLLVGTGCGLPLSEDLMMIIAGYVAFEEDLSIWVMMATCFFGVLTADSIVYLLGAKIGRRLAKHPFLSRWISPERLQIVKSKLNKKGNKLFFVARFVPGLRAGTFFSAGTLHVPYRTVILYDALAALVAIPLFVYSAYHFGETIERVVKVAAEVKSGLLVAALIIFLIFLLRWISNRRKAQAI